MLVIGVSDWMNKLELREMATDPDEVNVFLVGDFDKISTITRELQAILCDRE